MQEGGKTMKFAWFTISCFTEREICKYNVYKVVVEHLNESMKSVTMLK